MKKRNYFAPIIVGVITLIYLIVIIFSFTYVETNIWTKILFIIPMLGLIGVTIYVVIDRIKEIKGGEEDDLSKY